MLHPIRAWCVRAFFALAPPLLFAGPAPERVDAAEPKGPLGFDLSRGWFDAPVHSDFSARGTPFVDMQTLETPYLCHLVRVNLAAIDGLEEDEMELSAEIEWAVTRRILISAEVPYTWIDPDVGRRVEGFADMAVGARALLLEFDRFVLGANVEAGLPTGRRSVGLSEEEVIVEPSLVAWFDLGANITLNVQAGYERGVGSDSTEILYRSALAWSYKMDGNGEETQQHATAALAEHGHELHDSRAGLLSFRFEFTGRTQTKGEEEGLTTGETLVGMTYSPHDRFDLRVGYQFPVISPRQLTSAWLFSATLHF